MKVEPLEEGLILACNCPVPDRSSALCEELRSWGVASLLEVDDFVDSGAQRVHANLWCFKSPLSEMDAVSPFEQQVIRDFVRYELAQTRTVALWVENHAVRQAVMKEAVAAARGDALDSPQKRLVERRRCCASYHTGGCDPTLVCHAAPLAAAQEIVVTGTILSRSVLRAAPPEAVARTSSLGEPPDYFEYVMLANGSRVAPEAVAASQAGTARRTISKMGGTRVSGSSSILHSSPNTQE